jgi:hypothetical protein
MLSVIADSWGAGILLAFYLYLALNEDRIQRPALYRFGLVGWPVRFLAGLFAVGAVRQAWVGLAVFAGFVAGLAELWMLLAGLLACSNVFQPYLDDYLSPGRRERASSAEAGDDRQGG